MVKNTTLPRLQAQRWKAAVLFPSLCTPLLLAVLLAQAVQPCPLLPLRCPSCQADAPHLTRPAAASARLCCCADPPCPAPLCCLAVVDPEAGVEAMLVDEHASAKAAFEAEAERLEKEEEARREREEAAEAAAEGHKSAHKAAAGEGGQQEKAKGKQQEAAAPEDTKKGNATEAAAGDKAKGAVAGGRQAGAWVAVGGWQWAPELCCAPACLPGAWL